MFTAKQVMENALDAGLIDRVASDYSEPGYSLGENKKCIMFANWNPRSFDSNAHRRYRVMSRLADIAERAGCEVEWSDEWMVCDDCNKAIRSSPDSYGWRPACVVFGDSVVCRECVDVWDYLESIEGNYHTACALDIDPSDYG